ncbi:MAG: hypothetical protein GY944_26310 [bacterium]|nr:hypothetical protein [bacterium]
MPLRSEQLPAHLLLTSARPQAFTRLTRVILSRLGYGILTADELACLERERSEGLPDVEMLVMDEHRLQFAERLDPSGSLPIILLTGRGGIRDEDPRLVAAVKRPAGVHDLYRILQRHFQEKPRSTPRIETDLAVTCRRKGKIWSAAVRSLSDNGCLLHSSEWIPLGSTLSMTLELPGAGAVEIEAETAYQLVPDLGMVFNATPPKVRDQIGAYVLDTLAAVPDPDSTLG